MEICPKCKSNRIVPTRILDKVDGAAGILEVAIDETPDAIIFKNRTKSGVFAHVCGNCGFLEFYAFNPVQLYESYQRFLENEKTRTNQK